MNPKLCPEDNQPCNDPIGDGLCRCRENPTASIAAEIQDDGTAKITADNPTVERLFNLAARSCDENVRLRARCEALQDALLMVSGQWKRKGTNR